jgi:hypothetical protein
MALSSNYIRIILREHRRQALTGPVMQLGRQSVTQSYEELCDIFKSEGVSSESLPADMPLYPMKINGNPIDQPHRTTDTVFFAMLGITDVRSLDFSPLMNPNIIVDLNDPVPSDLHNQYGLIVDGGTFDHLFDMKQAFANIANMLKPGGRVIHWNAASNYLEYTYFLFSPAVFLDYYELNKFKDCRAYLSVLRNPVKEDWDLYEYTRTSNPAPFTDPRPVVTIIWAEKTNESTTHVVPTQGHWFEHPNEIGKIAEDAKGPSLRTRIHEFRQRHRALTALPYALWIPWRQSLHLTRRLVRAARMTVSLKRRSGAYRYLGRI